MDAPALFADPRFASASARHTHRRALHEEIETWTKTRDAADVERVLQKAGIAAHLSCNMRDIAESAEVLGRQDWLTPLARNKRFVVLAPVHTMQCGGTR